MFLYSCAKQINATDLKSSLIEKNTIRPGLEKASVVWELNPRSVVRGNDGQLLLRASESMNLLYAKHNKNGKQDLFLSKSKNIGDTFSNPIRVNSKIGEVSAHGENGPKLRQGKGRGIFAAWVENRDIMFARSMNFGKSFGSSLKVNNDSGKASQSFFTMEVAPDGTIFLAWLDGRDKKINASGTSSLYIARSYDNGVSFGKNIKVSGDICPCCRPAMAFGDPGQVFISWRHVFEKNERKIVIASSKDNGSTWSNIKPVTPKGWKINGCAHSGPTLNYVDRKLFVAWYTGIDSKARIKLARSLDQGETFDAMGNINGDVLDPNHPNMAKVGNEMWIIFQGRDPLNQGGWEPSKAWIVRLGKDGKIGKPEDLPTEGGGVAYPYLFSGTGGRVYAVWTETGKRGNDVVLCRGRIKSEG